MEKSRPVNKWKLLPKLALTGVMKNGAIYYPYIGAGIFSVFTYFIFSSILLNDIIATLPKSTYAWLLLRIGRGLLGIILLPFLYYTNSFLMKRRKREIGLYNILGLEKGHIGIMIFVETLFSYIAVLAGGILLGAVLAKLLFLLLLRMTGLPIDVEFVFYPQAIAETAVFFLWVYLFNLVCNLFEVGKAKPVELLASGKKGEKEPRFLWIYAVLGVVVLAWGYYIAVSSKIDSMIFMNFFLAVFFVVAGTYFLFTSGGVAFLKLLKKKKRVYYTPANFITISGMFYRMKKSAASLVNICIFSTMVIITLICTSSLYIGLDEVVYFDYPYDAGAYYESSTIDEKAVSHEMKLLEEKHSVQVTDMAVYDRIRLECGKEGNTFKIRKNTRDVDNDNYQVSIMQLSDYNRIENKELTLSEGEVIVFSTGADFGYDTVEFMGKEMRIKEELHEMRIEPKAEKNVFLGEYYLIVKDKKAHDKIVRLWAEANGIEDMEGFVDSDYRIYRYNVAGDEADRNAFINELKAISEKQPGYVAYYNNLEGRANIVSMNGGLLFIGIIFSLIFLMCLLLIMYYKQISEGYEDKDSFSIMQKVGMSDKEIKSTIHRQILLVFFVPLAGAVMHTCAGLFMVGQLFGTLRFFNTQLIVSCAAGVTLLFIIFYALSYMVTAKTYYGIVRQGEF